jgi:hypothetical protein
MAMTLVELPVTIIVQNKLELLPSNVCIKILALSNGEQRTRAAFSQQTQFPPKLLQN